MNPRGIPVLFLIVLTGLHRDLKFPWLHVCVSISNNSSTLTLHNLRYNTVSWTSWPYRTMTKWCVLEVQSGGHQSKVSRNISEAMESISMFHHVSRPKDLHQFTGQTCNSDWLAFMLFTGSCLILSSCLAAGVAHHLGCWCWEKPLSCTMIHTSCNPWVCPQKFVQAEVQLLWRMIFWDVGSPYLRLCFKLLFDFVVSGILRAIGVCTA